MSDRRLDLATANLAVRQAAGRRLRALAHPAPLDLLLLLYVGNAHDEAIGRRDASMRCGVSEAILDRWMGILAPMRLIACDTTADRFRLTKEGRRAVEEVLVAADPDSDGN